MIFTRTALEIRGRYRFLLPVMIALPIAIMSGLLVTGSERLSWWLLGLVAVPTLLGLQVGQHPVRPLSCHAMPYRRQTQYGRVTGLLLGVVCVVASGWLAIRQQPLPMADLGTAALVTVLFAALCIVLVGVVLRLSPLSFPMLFLGVTFLFTCSPLILYQTRGYDAFAYWRFIDLESVMLGLPVVMLAFAAFLTGALAAPVHANRPNPLSFGGPHDNDEALRLVGYCVYGLSLLLVLVTTLRGSALTLAFEGGYHDFAGTRRTGEMSRLVVASISWFMPWSVLILVATSRTRRTYLHMLLIATPAIAVMLLSGARAAPLAMILLIASGGRLLGISIDWLRSAVVAALVLLLVTTTVNVRNTPIRQWTPDLILKAATNQVEDSRTYNEPLLTSLLVGNSTSYQTLAGTMLFVPNVEPYRYGRDYVRALGAAVPFGHLLFIQLGVDLDEGEPSDWIKERLSPTTWAGLGYLQVAEAYLQFGAYGVAGLYLMLGLVVTWLWRSMEQGRPSARGLALVLLLMMALLIWVRNESVSLTRPLIWGWLLIYMLPALLDIRRPRRVRPLSPRQLRWR